MNYGGTSVPQTVVISIQLTCDAEKIQSETHPCYFNKPQYTRHYKVQRYITLRNITLLKPHYITG